MAYAGPYNPFYGSTVSPDQPCFAGSNYLGVDGCPVDREYTESTLTGVIWNDPRFTIMKKILGISKLAGEYNTNPPGRFGFTMLIPSDDILPREFRDFDPDIGTARRIILASTLKGIIPFDVFSGVYGFYNTRDPPTVLYIEGTNIGKTVNIIEGNITAANGMIHIVDKMLSPTKLTQ